jgi:non-heme chloroperoxidase
MSFVKTKDGVEIFYKDWGKGQPIVFSHGWPLSADDWDNQMLFFLSRGYRVIAHDRRGHGRSTQVADGHDLDHYATPPAAARWCATWRGTATGASSRQRSFRPCRL